MTSDETEASRMRAAALREQIARMGGKTPNPGTAGGDPSATPGQSSPRSLVEKRMRELDRDKSGNGSKS